MRWKIFTYPLEDVKQLRSKYLVTEKLIYESSVLERADNAETTREEDMTL
jgi:hypothetical protein